MRKKVLTVVVVPLIAVLAAQAAAASEYHHTRATGRTAACAPLRNSDAYAAPGDIAEQQSYWTNYANGEMASGPAGR